MRGSLETVENKNGNESCWFYEGSSLLASVSSFLSYSCIQIVFLLQCDTESQLDIEETRLSTRRAYSFFFDSQPSTDIMLSVSVIILITLAGSVATVTIAIGFGRMIGWIDDDVEIKPPSQEQEMYMRQVRARNAEDIYWAAVGGSGGRGNRAGKRSMSTLESLRAPSTDTGEH